MSTLDLLTMTEAKAAISNNAGTNNDLLLQAAVTGVSEFIDELCGPIVERDVDSEPHDGGQPVVFLKFRPVASVTSVTEYRHTTSTALTGQTAGTAPAEGYVLRADEGTITRYRLGRRSHFAHGEQNVVVTYVAGRCADTASVPERFKRAAAITLANYWRREHGGAVGATGFAGVTYGLPDAAKAWIHRDLKGVMA